MPPVPPADQPTAFAPLRTDTHIHTVFSGHSAPDMTLGAIVARAVEAGLERIGVVEHTPLVNEPNHCRFLEGGAVRPGDRRQIDAILDEREHLRAGGDLPLDLLVGAEVDADPHRMDGRLLLEDLGDLDFVLSSTHYLPHARGVWYDGTVWPQAERDAMLEEWIAWAAAIAANPRVDVLAHPTAALCKIGAVESFDETVAARFDPMLDACRAFGTAFELNELIADKMTPAQAESYYHLLRRARDRGARFVFGSDAHALQQIGRFDRMRPLAESLGLTEAHFITPARHTATPEACTPS